MLRYAMAAPWYRCPAASTQPTWQAARCAGRSPLERRAFVSLRGTLSVAASLPSAWPVTCG
jgi:hypothetical protein